MNKQLKIYCIIIIVLLLLPGTLLKGQVNTENFRKDDDKDAIEVKCGLSLALYKGNTDIFRLSSNLNINYTKGKNYAFLVGNITYGEKSKSSYINKGFSHQRFIRKLSKRFMVEVLAQQEFNEFIKLKSRFLIGGGLRTLLFKSEKENSGIAISIGTGLMWETEKYNKSGDTVIKEDSSLFKSTNYLSLNCRLNKAVTLRDVTYIQVNIGGESSTRITSDLNFEVKLSKKLSYTAKCKYRYDSTPPIGIKDYDIQITNGLAFTL
ncbi:MAG: DUF481 domain-containing protein [bacterium]|nr:DUF481 domain-containing protein [bacterium]